MYIRTKDGVYDGEKYNADYILDYELGKIIKQSENLEELCDGVIEKCLSGNRFHYICDFNKKEAMKVMNIDINKGYKELYFGIFVNHSNKIDFISVAKMNDKGDLELI